MRQTSARSRHIIGRPTLSRPGPGTASSTTPRRPHPTPSPPRSSTSRPQRGRCCRHRRRRVEQTRSARTRQSTATLSRLHGEQSRPSPSQCGDGQPSCIIESQPCGGGSLLSSAARPTRRHRQRQIPCRSPVLPGEIPDRGANFANHGILVTRRRRHQAVTSTPIFTAAARGNRHTTMPREQPLSGATTVSARPRWRFQPQRHVPET